MERTESLCSKLPKCGEALNKFSVKLFLFFFLFIGPGTVKHMHKHTHTTHDLGHVVVVLVILLSKDPLVHREVFSSEPRVPVTASAAD